jgi:tetratricopeptide (TPR) repeat protein
MTTTTIAEELIATVGNAATARDWLSEAIQQTPNDLDAHLALFATSIVLESHLPGSALPGPMGAIERAYVSDDWQAAYDAAMYTPLSGAAMLARMLVVADGLRQSGAAEAALDVLTRALDHYPSEPAVYGALVPVLSDLGRGADADLAAQLASN